MFLKYSNDFNITQRMDRLTRFRATGEARLQAVFFRRRALHSYGWRVVRFVFSAFCVAAISGCAAVGRDYTPPPVAAPAEWNAPLEEGITVNSYAIHELATWWTRLNDPVLSRLIERAASGNRDLKKARARVREARARRGISAANLFPVADSQTSATRNAAGTTTPAGGSSTSDVFKLGLDASWEIDLFGGVRRSVEAADADIQAQADDLRDVLVSLLAEVALNYTELCTSRMRLAVARETLQSREDTYNLLALGEKAGMEDSLAVRQSLYSMESVRAQIPPLKAAISEAENRLAVLVGENPGALKEELKPQRPIPSPPSGIAVAVPADMLRQRPDVRRAERQLAAQTARIGVARAELYPKLKLSGAIGLSAPSTGTLLSSDAGTASGAFGLTWRVFDAGAIRRNIEVQSALQEQSLVAWETAVVKALEEVENALKAYAEERKRRRSLGDASAAAAEALELARIKFSTGLTDYTTVLEAERSLLGFRDQELQSMGNVISNLITIYKAMGGGWTSSE